MNRITTIVETPSDEVLCRRSCHQDREAFGMIVERYQSLVCSLAYSACGDFARSEDLAQEAFVVAWGRIGELREPAKLRSWLCGIVRNLTANSCRRVWRRGGPSQPLESVEEHASAEQDPATIIAASEECSLLWRCLGELPVAYREPLVLFYREQQSITEVAQQLDLSEDTVKQRLARGRARLRQDLAGLVESTLARTRPGKGFTSAVLVALSAAAGAQSATAASGPALAAKSGAASAKGFFAKSLGLLGGAGVGLSVSWLSAKALQSTARSEKERRLMTKHARRSVIVAFAMCALLVVVLS